MAYIDINIYTCEVQLEVLTFYASANNSNKENMQSFQLKKGTSDRKEMTEQTSAKQQEIKRLEWLSLK